MRTMTTRKSIVLCMLTVSLATGAVAKTVQVGTCLPNFQQYSTISQAVSAVTPGSTVLVCPGTYAEQVTITQPLTLRGVQTETAANATIVSPPGGLTQSVILPGNDATAFFQVMVQATGAGLVNISNLGVDGSNNQVTTGWVLGIYYQNSSGTIESVATYNQIAEHLGFGIFLESTTPTMKTVTITKSSVHDFDSGGIRCNCPTSMIVDINSNSVVGSNSANSNSPEEGIDTDAAGKISNNTVLSNPAPPATSQGVGIAYGSNTVVSGNTVIGWGVGIWGGDSNIIKSNRVSKGGVGIILGGTNNDVEHNFLANFPVSEGGAGISFNCTGSGNTVIHNQVNDAFWGIVDPHGTNTTSPNTFTNVQFLVSPPC